MEKYVTIDDYTLKVTDEGNYFENAEDGYVYPIYKNPRRRNRETIQVKGKCYYTHRIVAKAFPEICGEWFDGCEVHHKDRNPSNNRADNLEVVSKEWHDREHSGEFNEKTRLKNSIPVHQYTLDGKYVASYPSSIAASNALFPEDAMAWHRSAIRNCLCGFSKSAFGYMWIHSDNPPISIDPIKPNITPAKMVTNGEKTFKSLKEAAEYYGVGITAINNCLKGRTQTCCGYKWRYVS